MNSINPCAKCGSTERDKFNRCRPCHAASSAKYVANNKEKAAAASRAWKEKNRERVREYSARYASEHVDEMKEYRKHNKHLLDAATKRHRELNPDSQRIATSNFRAAHPEKSLIDSRKRRGVLAVRGRLSRNIVEKLQKLQRGKCACGCKQPLGDDYHLDHRMPLALGGTNTDDNIQLLRKSCNLQKSAKHPVDFAQQRGFLL